MDHSISVLHVDDVPSITDLTGTFLERENDQFAVETATSADEGLKMINDRPPDCIVSDYNMPGMDGIEFLQAVRGEHPGLPFILFTGKGNEVVASEAIAADVTDYLQKGSGSEQYELLANRIQNAVQARRETQRADRQKQLMRLTEFVGDTGGFELDTETGEMLLTDGLRDLIDLPAQADLSVDDAIGLYHLEDREDIRQTIDRARQTGEQTHGTWRLQAQDDEERLVDVTFTPATTDGDTEILRGAVHDITDQQDRQQEVQGLKKRLELAVKGAGLGVWDWNMITDKVEFNHQFVQMLGYSLEEFGESLDAWKKRCHPDDLEQVEAGVKAQINDETSHFESEHRIQMADGDWKWVQNRGQIVDRDEDGTPIRAIGIHLDISERKEHEQELQNN